VILNRLRLTNFGPFRGVHEFALTPDNGRDGQPRRVVLFGGKNGSGKTSILTAVRLCLFGPLAFGERVGEQEYANRLAACAHRPGDRDTADDLSAVELEFDYVIMGKAERFRVRREWDPRAAGRDEHVSVVTDREQFGDRASDQWDQFVRHLIPPGVADLFFFDGEAIQALADDDLASGRLADSVASLLGLDLVDRLSNDLVAYQRYYLLRTLDRERRQEVRDQHRHLERLRTRRAALRQDLAHQQSRLDRLEAEIERKRGQLAREGGMLPEEAAEFAATRDRLRAEVAELETAARELCAGELPVALCPSLARRLSTQLADERTRTANRYGREMIGSLLPDLTSELLSRGVRSSADAAKGAEADELTESLQEAVSAALAKRQGSDVCEVVHDLSESQTQAVTRAIGESLPAAVTAASELIEKLTETTAQLEELERRLSQLPDDEHLAHLVEPLRLLQGERTSLVKAMAETESESRALDTEIDETERAVDREIQETRNDREASETTDRKRALVAGLRRALGEYRSGLVAERVGELSETVSRTFGLLSRKGDRAAAVELQRQGLEITIRDARGRSIPHGSLSAGERQVLAIAFLWSLAQVSRRQLPVIVDTPLARLDSDHRGNLIRSYFPEASHQMIVLSTDTEVDRELFRQLGPRIARAHRLEYDEAEAATRVSTGYFWRAQDGDPCD